MEELALFAASRKPTKAKNDLRAIVQDVVDHGKKEMLFCLVHSGSIKVGQKVRLAPSGLEATVLEIYLKGKKAKSAGAGSNIAVAVNRKSRAKRGFILIGANDKLHTARSFESITFFVKGASSDSDFAVKINNNSVPAKITKVMGLISTSTGAVRKGASRIPSGSAARLKMELEWNYPIERFSDYNALGRFALYSDGKFCGIGIVV
jgi:translation elongation factor EF-1alpha